MKKNLLLRIGLMLAVYFGLTYYGGENGRIILTPIRLLVTYLHEFGHAFGALITGGSVLNLQVNPDGSGLTTSQGGNVPIILMGGYIGSAFFGNLLFYIGTRNNNNVAKITTYILAGTMLIAALLWFSSPFTTGLLVAFALAFILIARYTEFDSDILMFLGLASILYIIQDFNVGPTSDLEHYAREFKIIPANVWMYIWLGLVLIMLFYNVRLIFRTKTIS